jgi:hypothetical protein
MKTRICVECGGTRNIEAFQHGNRVSTVCSICRGLMEPKRIPSGKQRRESRVINAGYRLVLFGV